MGDDMPQRRALLEVDDMVCGEHGAKDGSIVCTFRAMPPSNPNTATIIHDCLKISGSDLCLAADISMESLIVPGESNNIIVPSPVSAPNLPPTPPPTQEVNVPIQIFNGNPACPPQNEVPESGDSCDYSGKYFACDYFSSLSGPRIQCRCNHDNLFYCRTVDDRSESPDRSRII